MKLGWQPRLLPYLVRSNGFSPAGYGAKQSSQIGFTLLELLVVILILGVLSALTIPSLLSQVTKAREAEAKTFVAAINRGQQAYYLEKGTFGSLESLNVGLSQSNNYIYTSYSTGQGLNAQAITTAQPRVTTIRGYGGRVWISASTAGNATTQSIVCPGAFGSTPSIQSETCP